MIEEVAEQMGMKYTETPISRYVAQGFDDFLFPWEEGSVNNPITIKMGEGFTESRTPVSEPPRQPRWRQDQLRAPLRTCKVLRTQLLDSSLICKKLGCCLVFCNLFFFASSNFILKR